MHEMHSMWWMIDRIRALLVVVEEGSINRASVRLRITQPALSRRIKSLEDELGGRLLERESSGVKPTGLGHSLIKAMTPVLQSYEAALAEVRRDARGLRSELRIGYLISAAQAVLTPALERLRQGHPDLKLKLHDMSPREQIDALRAGDIDIALIGQEGATAIRDFHSAKLSSVRVCAAVASSDPLARRPSLALDDLKDKDFIGIDEDQVPGRNRWMSSLCQAAGFKPRFVGMIDGITEVLSEVVAESAVTLLPDYFRSCNYPGVSFVPVSDRGASWDLFLLWQRGKVSPSTRALVDALKTVGAELGE